jgi:hypothetical protein
VKQRRELSCHFVRFRFRFFNGVVSSIRVSFWVRAVPRTRPRRNRAEYRGGTELRIGPKPLREGRAAHRLSPIRVRPRRSQPV